MSHREDRSVGRAPDGGRGRGASRDSFSVSEHDDIDSGPRAFRPLLRAGAERFNREAANRPILMFEDVYKSYRPGAPVLRGMNLIIERGEFVFITGPSGSGTPARW